MKKDIPLAQAKTENLADYVERSYLNYSMFVILDRALPQLADGLKPVQRRIIYAMSELGLAGGAKYKKSARTIGDVLGKFHPHGDVACYEAMVLMAQRFSTRYPLVDGQGNWGSTDDPKSFAAMRYTEARLTPYAKLMLDELAQDTVEWQPNFDNTLKEPQLLPAQIPNILLNGASGIAVGMATDIPSHNLSEMMNACLLLLDEKTSSKTTKNTKKRVREIRKKMPMPDFPCGGVIVSSEKELEEMYVSGRSNLQVRASFETEEQKIVITQLPPQTSVLRIVEQVRQQMQNKKLPMVTDLRDESDDQNPIRLVIYLRRGTAPDDLMAHLFATTDLERSVRVNLNMIGTDGRPQTKSLDKILDEWLQFRRATVKRKLTAELNKTLARLHLLEGLLKVYLNLDEVIRIIRNNDKPKPILIKKFSISETQAEAILETKLRHLAKLEEEKIRGEEEDLTDKRYFLESTLKSNKKITGVMQDEFKTIKKEYGDKRRTQLIEKEGVLAAKVLTQEHTTRREAVTLVVSEKGWVRLAKGHDLKPAGFSYREGDFLLSAVEGYNDRYALFLDNSGRAYTLPATSLPSARGLGEPLSSRLDIPDGMKIQGTALALPQDTLLLASKTGHAFIAEYGSMLAKGRKRGKQVMRIKEDAGLVQPALMPVTEEECYVLCLSEKGRVLVVDSKEIAKQNVGRGNILMRLNKDDSLRQILVLRKGDEVLIQDENEDAATSWGEWLSQLSRSGNKGSAPKVLKQRDLKSLRLSVKHQTPTATGED